MQRKREEEYFCHHPLLALQFTNQWDISQGCRINLLKVVLFKWPFSINSRVFQQFSFSRFWVFNHSRKGLHAYRRDTSSKKNWRFYLDEPSCISCHFSTSKKFDVYYCVPGFITTYWQVITYLYLHIVQYMKFIRDSLKNIKQVTHE